MTDVFISYSRRDKEFVEALHTALVKCNRDAWVDWQDIPLTADWWQEIERGIEAADTFVFVISPDSVASVVCTQEIDHAVKNSKRLVPVVRRDDFIADKAHPALGKHNWLFFREKDDFNQAFQSLLTALDTDLNHVKEHTRLLVRAIEWNQKDRNSSFLLRGDDLQQAEQWITQGASKQPQPTELHGDYINASRQAEAEQQERELTLVRERLAEEQRARKAAQARNLIGGIALLITAVGLTYYFINDRITQEAKERAGNYITYSRETRALYNSLLDQVASEKLAERKNIALNIIKEWKIAKKEVYAPPYDKKILKKYLTNSFYLKKEKDIDWLIADNSYYLYQKDEIKEVLNFITSEDAMIITLLIHQQRTFCKKIGGIMIQPPIPPQRTADEEIIESYTLIRTNSDWKIQKNATLNKNWSINNSQKRCSLKK